MRSIKILKNIVFAVVLLLTTLGVPAKDKETLALRLWLWIPEHQWALTMNAGDSLLDRNELGKNQSGGWLRQVQMHDDKTGLISSAFIEQGGGKNDVVSLRDEQWSEKRRKLMNVSDFKKIDHDGLTGVEYMVKSIDGTKMNQKGMHFYWIKEDCWLEIHLSKMNFHSGEEKLFVELTKPMEILQSVNPSVTSDWLEASGLFLQEKYEAAIPIYEKVLVSEKKSRVLGDTLSRGLVSNLSLGYLEKGELKKSENTLLYGVSLDPKYALFHYLLANTYAEMNKLDEAIASLKLAYEYRSNMPPDEPALNARRDNTFDRWKHNDKFLKALTEMEKGK